MILIVQPLGEFNDYRRGHENGVELYRSRWGNKFYIDDGKDILIEFAPVRWADGNRVRSHTGKIKVKVKHVKDVPLKDRVDPMVIISKKAIEQLNIESKQPVDTMTHTRQSNSSLPLETPYIKSHRINWLGEKVPDGPWIEQNLFSIDDFKVGNKDLVYGGSSALLILFALLVACLSVSYYKRKFLSV